MAIDSNDSGMFRPVAMMIVVKAEINVSVNSKTDHLSDSHILVAPGVRFSPPSFARGS